MSSMERSNGSAVLTRHRMSGEEVSDLRRADSVVVVEWNACAMKRIVDCCGRCTQHSRGGELKNTHLEEWWLLSKISGFGGRYGWLWGARFGRQRTKSCSNVGELQRVSSNIRGLLVALGCGSRSDCHIHSIKSFLLLTPHPRDGHFCAHLFLTLFCVLTPRCLAVWGYTIQTQVRRTKVKWMWAEGLFLICPTSRCSFPRVHIFRRTIQH